MNEIPPSPDLLRYGLSRAIQLHSEEFRVKHPEIRLDLDLVEDEFLLPPGCCLALYQVYLAGISSLAQGENACAASVRYYPGRDGMVLEIRTDGTSLALPGKEDVKSVEKLGGKVELLSPSGQMEKLRANVPFPKKG